MQAAPFNVMNGRTQGDDILPQEAEHSLEFSVRWGKPNPGSAKGDASRVRSQGPFATLISIAIKG